MSNPRYIHLVAALAGAAFTGGALYTTHQFTHKNSPLFTGSCGAQYPLTSQELDCNLDETAQKVDRLNTLLDEKEKELISNGKAQSVSVWTRDLNSRQWAATNEDEQYSPASLIKLPLLVAYYKVAQVNPQILNQTLVYNPTPEAHDDTLYFTRKTSLIPGQSYTVEDLLQKMIVDSDNESAMTLFTNIGADTFEHTLVDLGIKIPLNADTVDFVTAHTYATIFRILFNASYLNREYSQKALNLMTQIDFKGIKAPLPNNTLVSHKFGERTIVDNSNQKVLMRELADCGIIYGPNGPYTLCIMTKGRSFDDLSETIKSISKLVYDQLQ